MEQVSTYQERRRPTSVPSPTFATDFPRFGRARRVRVSGDLDVSNFQRLFVDADEDLVPETAIRAIMLARVPLMGTCETPGCASTHTWREWTSIVFNLPSADGKQTSKEGKAKP